MWELEVDRSALVPVGLRHRAVRAEVIACPDVPDYCSAYERVIWSAGLTPGPAPLLLPRRDRSGKTKKSKRVKVDTGSCLRRWQKHREFAPAMRCVRPIAAGNHCDDKVDSYPAVHGPNYVIVPSTCSGAHQTLTVSECRGSPPAVYLLQF